MKKRRDNSLRTPSLSPHASKPNPSAHTLLTSLIENYLSLGRLGRVSHLNRMGWESGPPSLYRGTPENKVLGMVVSCLESWHSGDLSQKDCGKDQARLGSRGRLSHKMKTKVGVVPHIWEILELPPTLNVSLEPASLPLFQVQPRTQPTPL